MKINQLYFDIDVQCAANTLALYHALNLAKPLLKGLVIILREKSNGSSTKCNNSMLHNYLLTTTSSILS